MLPSFSHLRRMRSPGGVFFPTFSFGFMPCASAQRSRPLLREVPDPWIPPEHDLEKRSYPQKGLLLMRRGHKGPLISSNSDNSAFQDFRYDLTYYGPPRRFFPLT